MKKQKNKLCDMSAAQMSPGLADPRDFQVNGADDYTSSYVPAHGQCGANEREYDGLLAEGERSANASDFEAQGEEHPTVEAASNRLNNPTGR